MSALPTSQTDHTAELTAKSLLLEHPDALVCGLSPIGLIVPIPADVALWGQAVLEGRAVPDLVVAADRRTVIDLWQHVHRDGAVQGKVRLLSKPSRWMALHFLDIQYAHGILLCVILPPKTWRRRGTTKLRIYPLPRRGSPPS
jgi:hypothetical protein